ncbi:ferredoxin [Acidocella sp.]|uniref:(2Fe-2S) ferredoxin domain-containing protein n=1 Tax=Acidocella sp. TaxID=50710 RepID=UPI0017C1378F|nr:(2Fe-2S) ferredoxin domain-containing protein [Acidocella sp.]NNM56435.1 (2Fe-2S) ferredoxin domain-containing protein [Acidocella sp.]
MSELPQVFKHHVFMCLTQRPPGHPHGSCGTAGSSKYFDLLKAKLDAESMNGEIGLSSSGCLGFCTAQPLMVVYPQGVWYRPQAPEDVDEIVESFKSGTIIERLAVVPAR